ncbi:MAG TPA: AAA family ATPase [Caulobacteraceae bacterium]
MRTIAVIALKGGSGKTTVATHLALAAHLRGVDTLLIDTDRQRSAQNVLAARTEAGPACIVSTGPKLMASQFAAVGLGKRLLIVDTAAGAVEDVTEAIVLADLALMIARPTLLDLAGLAPSLGIVRRLGKPGLVVMNQAPVPREEVEAPLVKRALRALDHMQAPVAPVILRSRAIYQTALETGRSAEEMNDPAAVKEIAALWDYIDATLEMVADEAAEG